MKYRLKLELIDDDGTTMEAHELSVPAMSKDYEKDIGKIMGRMANAVHSDNIRIVIESFLRTLHEFPGWSLLTAASMAVKNDLSDAADNHAFVVMEREHYNPKEYTPMNLRLVGRDVWDAVNAERNKR